MHLFQCFLHLLQFLLQVKLLLQQLLVRCREEAGKSENLVLSYVYYNKFLQYNCLSIVFSIVFFVWFLSYFLQFAVLVLFKHKDFLSSH